MRLGARTRPPLLLALLALVTLPGLASGQSLDERELEYREALDVYRAALRARNTQAFRQDVVLDSLATARDQEDQILIDRLEGQARIVGLDFASRSARVQVTSEAYETARGALLEALDQRLDSLSLVVERATDPVERQTNITLITDLQGQYRDVLTEDLQETIPLRPLVEPSLAVEARDTPASLLRKAQLLESRAAKVQREIDEVDADLDRYRRAQQLERFTGDVTSAIDRFGDRTVPVRSQAGDARTGQTIVADSTVVDLDALAPADAIVALERYRQQLVTILEQTLARATDLRSRLNGDRRGEELR